MAVLPMLGRLREGDSAELKVSLVGAAKLEVDDDMARVAKIREELEESFML